MPTSLPLREEMATSPPLKLQTRSISALAPAEGVPALSAARTIAIVAIGYSLERLARNIDQTLLVGSTC
jgi:hypothetical protein